MMASVSRLLVATWLLSVVGFTAALTPAEVTAERAYLKEEIRKVVNVAGHLRMVAGAVRLAFHDCVGGCDGCINLLNSENNGLASTINNLGRFYRDRNIQNLMSRADYWVLAGFAALDIALEEACGDNQVCPSLPLVFRYGRIDCTTSPNTQANHSFPNPHAGTDATLQFFNTEFGLSERETVALMGAHTLGHASLRNSGFMGPWVRNENNLDNEFYRVLQNPNGWVQIRLPSRNYQWNIPPRPPQPPSPNFMLNSDICLLKDITVTPTGDSTCRFGDCADARTSSIVNEYARDNAKWLVDFSEAFRIMVSKSGTTLKNVASATAPSGQPQSPSPGAPTPAPTPTTATASKSFINIVLLLSSFSVFFSVVFYI